MSLCLLSTLALAPLAGCASPQRDQPTRPRALFISPQGEPFRAAASGPSAMQLWLAQADADGDKRLSRAEFARDATRFFARLDADQDGTVTSSEVTTLQTQLAPEVMHTYAPLEDIVGYQRSLQVEAAARDRDLPKGDRRKLLERPQGAQAYGLLNEIEPTMSADADLSRRVTPAEFAAAADRRFTLLDRDKNGFFEESETPNPYWASGPGR